MDSPALMYSMKVWTGTRVPANTGVPPSISGEAVIVRVAIDLSYEKTNPVTTLMRVQPDSKLL